MEKGTLRVDANVSVRPAGSYELRTRCELKNMNSFRFVAQGIDAEVARQIAVYESGGEVVQETYDFDAGSGTLTPRRSKEEADDYRYFPEPDLVPVEPPAELVERLRAEVPESPARADPADRGRARPRPRRRARHRRPRRALAGDGRGGRRPARRGERDREPARRRRRGRGRPGRAGEARRGARPDPARRRSTRRSAKVAEPGFTAAPYLAQEAVSDTAELEPIVARILAANPGQVAAYRGGKEGLLGFFVGQVMKETGGKANARVVSELVREKLQVASPPHESGLPQGRADRRRARPPRQPLLRALARRRRRFGGHDDDRPDDDRRDDDRGAARDDRAGDDGGAAHDDGRAGDRSRSTTSRRRRAAGSESQRDSVAQGRQVVLTVTSDARRRGPPARLRPERRRRARRARDDPLHGRRTGPLRDRAREHAASRSPSSRFAPEPARPRDRRRSSDLPVPEWLFFWGGAVVLVLSFLALGALWKQPQLERRRGGRPLPAGLERVLRSRAPARHRRRPLGRPARARLPDRADRRAVVGAEPRADLHLRRLLARARAAAGAVRERLARAEPVARDRERRRVALAAARARSGRRRSTTRSGSASGPARSRSSASRRSSSPTPSPRARARWRSRSRSTATRCGSAWPRSAGASGTSTGNGFTRLLRPARADRAVRRARRQARPADAVLRASPGAETDARDARVRRGDARLGRVRRPQPLAVLAGPPRRRRRAVHRRRSRGRRSCSRPALALAGLIGCILARRARLPRRRRDRRADRSSSDRSLAPEFVQSLVPIALVYAVAHYFTLLVIQGQYVVPARVRSVRLRLGSLRHGGLRAEHRALLARTPSGTSRSARSSPATSPASPSRTTAPSRSCRERDALRSQYAMLGLMVVYTVGGLWLLSRG